MDGEKYVNYYIEALSSTLNEAILNNISLQTNARISSEALEEQKKKIDSILLELEHHKDIIASKELTISDLQAQVFQHNDKQNEYESVKNQVQHLDTFRTELLKERELHQQTRNEYENRIQKLNEQIEYLQLTPAKRKKVDEAKATVVATSSDTTKDGGSF